MKALFILNGAPYGDEPTYNGLRLAGALAKQAEHEVRVFLLGDAAPTAKAGQKVPEGFYNLQLMLSRVARSGDGRVCGPLVRHYCAAFARHVAARVDSLGCLRCGPRRWLRDSA